MKRQKDVSNRSDELTYQLWRHDDSSESSKTFKLITKMGKFFFAYYAINFFDVSGGSVSLRYQLIRCYIISKTLVSFRYQLRRRHEVLNWSVSLKHQLVRSVSYVLRRLTLIGFIYVKVRSCKDISNRSVLFMYKLWRRDNVLAWSATSWTNRDLIETSLRCRMLGGASLWIILRYHET